MDMKEDYRPRERPTSVMHPHDERPYAYCPMCGGELEPRTLKPTEPDRLVCTRCGFVFYVDPKVAVGTIIADDRGHVVLVRRAIEPGYGKWVIPGGYVDRGEEVHVAAVREAREEAGLDIRLERLVNVYSYRGVAPVIIVYAARLVGGVLCCDDEGLEARFFAPDEIPWTELAFRSTYQALREYLGPGPGPSSMVSSPSH
jgi:ADP-ribose pyrophosphatase YjhB (NUDIX family)